jgi:hypothetical protein
MTENSLQLRGVLELVARQAARCLSLLSLLGLSRMSSGVRMPVFPAYRCFYAPRAAPDTVRRQADVR